MTLRTIIATGAALLVLSIGAAGGYAYALHASGVPTAEWLSAKPWPEYPRTHLKVIGAWGNLTQYRGFEEPFWNRDVEARSKGAISADITPFNEAGLDASGVMRLLQSGAVDFASVVLGYLAADDARNEAADLAGLAPDVFIARKIVESYKPVYQKLYREKYGIEVLAIWPYSAQVLFCNSPIASLSELKGKRVRTASRSMAEFVEALGGEAVALSFADVLPALRRGSLHCGITGALSGNSAKWHEATTHVHMLPLGWSLVLHGVSRKTWTRLDPRVRDFLKTEVANLEDVIWRAAAAETQDGFDCNAGTQACKGGNKGKMTLVEVTSTERVIRRYTLIEAVLPRWAARCPGCVPDWNASIGKVVGIAIDAPASN